jgi:hypothetical protein
MTNDIDSLIRHLKNLQQQGAKQSTLDVEWLLSVLPKSQTAGSKNFFTAHSTVVNDVAAVEVDGGKFSD